MRLPYLSAKLQGFGTTIFSEMSALAVQHSAVNLGQGFPNFAMPQHVMDAALDAIKAGHNQYAPGLGVPHLRQAIAEHQKRFYDLDVNPDTEVTVTAGATEAICATIMALCDSGDEVVLFEPFYDSYRASVAMAGGVERVVPITAPALTFDPADLELAFTDKTKLVLLNTPHNPTGKVFSRDELEQIARLCIEHDVICVSDEVYEHLVFEGQHIPIASLPGMAERTVTISSAGKTFSCTGWKVGWTIAAPAITTAIRTAKQFMTFTNGTPFQHATAVALASPDEFYTGFLSEYTSRKDRLVGGLQEVGFDVIVPAGTYFVCVDIRPLGYDDGYQFCRELPEKVGVVAIPNQVFYADERRGKHLVRFAFCKTDDELDEGVARLKKLTRS